MNWFARSATAGLLALGVFSTSSSAFGQGADSLTRLRETLKKEPRAPDVVRMALDYYRVSPEQMDSVRSAAHTRAWLPVFSGFATYTTTGQASATTQTISNPQNVFLNNAINVTQFTGGFSWDLRELVFNPAEVQTYAVAPMQRDITLEVVRTYFLRRQLQIRLALKPPADPLALATMDLRVEEYTGILNAMTGGQFTRQAQAAAQPQ